jgi:tRNA G37 N-methylase Trm5
MVLEDYRERAERVRELVVEAWALVAEACRSSCARKACEEVEDYLASAIDEAEEAARLPGPWLSIPHVAEAARNRLNMIETRFLEAFGGYGTFSLASLNLGLSGYYFELNPVAYFFFRTFINQ